MSKEVVRNAIRNTISCYQENPYFNIREADYCSEIVSAIRNYLRVKIVNADIYSKNQAEIIKSDVCTNRVHQEASFPHTKNAEWVGPEADGKIDIVLLREKQVSLLVSSSTLECDTWAQYQVRDIEAAIEVKCTPLHNGDISDIIKDLMKLKMLGLNGVEDLHFVQINTGDKCLFKELEAAIKETDFSTSNRFHEGGQIKIWDSRATLNPTFVHGAEAYDVSGGVPANPMTIYFYWVKTNTP